ncbi:Utp14 protein [Ancylostoma caninum]|uniref:Utp14 protein n=1 Tax=Ancylostoma caninum TaxID=29170 RepID=A0A368H3W3_ANCCA|nr:Utp14 protein [Ancylostoma caninum]
MSDDEFDEIKHDKLLASVLDKKEQVPIRKSAARISSDVLINSVKHSKVSTALAKQKLEQEKKEKDRVGASQTVAVPVHRQASERIKGAVGFIELKKDLKVWDDVVKSNRLADQLSFPLNEETMLATEKAADRAEAFKPKTEFEKKMMEMWNGSKNNMTNDTVYTEAEMEIIRAMDVKEAKEKLNQMQKMRALISYREAKYRYAAKIKSKGYHRILKRQKRKQLIKEFDELLVRDPEAAKEKLIELENQRVIERGSLKHRARTKFQQDIVKYAGRDSRAKQVLEEHFRLGRDLKSKVSLESGSEAEEEQEKEEKKMSVSEMIKSAAIAAAKSEGTGTGLVEDSNDADEARIALYELRAKKRRELEAARSRATKKATDSQPIFEQESDWTFVPSSTKDSSDLADHGDKNESRATSSEIKADISDEAPHVAVASAESGRNECSTEKGSKAGSAKGASNLRYLAGTKAKKRKITKDECTAKDIDRLFDAAEEKVVEGLKEVETTNLSKVSSELIDKMDEFDEDQANAVAEAFKDDDVIGDFEEDKEFIEEGERPKDVDLTLQGWGCWVGPGMTERKRRKQFVIKARQKKRKDKNRPGVIIKETQETSIAKLQPSSLPFPYTSVVDFETMVSQPIGKDWNPISVTHDLCKPAVVTQGGRSIRPVKKAEVLAGKLILDD